ncbi:MAG: hypothetical protein AAF587_05640 [Bacteroidota bacterium]
MRSGTVNFRLLILGLSVACMSIGIFSLYGPGNNFFISSLSASHSTPFPTVNGLEPPAQAERLQGSCLYMDDAVLLDLSLDEPDKVRMMVHQVGGQTLYMRHWNVKEKHLREEIDLSQLEKGVYVLHIQSSDKEMKQVLVL